MSTPRGPVASQPDASPNTSPVSPVSNAAANNGDGLRPGQLEGIIRPGVEGQPIVDMHTHLYPPAFGTPCRNARARRPVGADALGRG